MQRISRREFFAAGVAGSAGLMLASRLSALETRGGGVQSDRAVDAMRETYFEFRPVRDGLIAVIGGGGNAAIWRTPTGEALLVDCKHAHLGYTLHREITAQGHKLSKVINTHHHLDHTGGNYAFNESLEIVAHQHLTPRVRDQVESAKARARGAISDVAAGLSGQQRSDYIRVEERLDSFTAADFVPDTEMNQSEMDVRLGTDHVVQLRYVSHAHTDNDVFLYFPGENVMHTGDLLFNKLNPYIDVSAGASTRGWQKCLAEMISVCNAETIVIPGHGEITDVEELRTQDRYFDSMREFVRQARLEDRSRDEITAMMPECASGYGNEHVLARDLGVFYDELEREDG